MAAPDPREAWNRIQTELARRSSRFGGAGGGAPKGLGGGAAALALVVGGVFVANNALFNGTSSTLGHCNDSDAYPRGIIHQSAKY